MIAPLVPLAIRGKQAGWSFWHLGDRSVAKDNTWVGFEISGDGKDFVHATAVIEGNPVVVTNGDVPHPVAVRYDWNNLPEASLYNKNDLP